MCLCSYFKQGVGVIPDMDSRSVLKCTTLLFAVVVHCSREDPVYHCVLLALTCLSIIRHWVESVPPVMAVLDSFVARACYVLCAYTHVVEHPSTWGGVCLFAVLGLWTYECRTSGDWRRAHALLHLAAIAGSLLAVHSRSRKDAEMQVERGEWEDFSF